MPQETENNVGTQNCGPQTCVPTLICVYSTDFLIIRSFLIYVFLICLAFSAPSLVAILSGSGVM